MYLFQFIHVLEEHQTINWFSLTSNCIDALQLCIGTSSTVYHLMLSCFYRENQNKIRNLSTSLKRWMASDKECSAKENDSSYEYNTNNSFTSMPKKFLSAAKVFYGLNGTVSQAFGIIFYVNSSNLSSNLVINHPSRANLIYYKIKCCLALL